MTIHVNQKKVVPMKKILSLIGICIFITGCVSNISNTYEGNTGYMQADQPEAPEHLGMRYLLGRGVPKDDNKAFENFLIAANEDDALAQNQVAYMYAAGQGTTQNYEKAFEYYQKAANHGLASAQYNLGLLYEHGLGAAPNKAVACSFFQKAAANGFEPAKRKLPACGSSR